MAVSSEIFRQVMSKCCTGVTIVTIKNNGVIHGLTVNAFTSVSLDPPLILICRKKNGNDDMFISEGHPFVVNILSEEQIELANRFVNSALNAEERFKNVPFRETERHVPILEGNLSHLECRIVNQFDGGDHIIFLGEVERADFSEGKRPLLFYKSQFHHL